MGALRSGSFMARMSAGAAATEILARYENEGLEDGQACSQGRRRHKETHEHLKDLSDARCRLAFLRLRLGWAQTLRK